MIDYDNTVIKKINNNPHKTQSVPDLKAKSLQGVHKSLGIFSFFSNRHMLLLNSH